MHLTAWLSFDSHDPIKLSPALLKPLRGEEGGNRL